MKIPMNGMECISKNVINIDEIRDGCGDCSVMLRGLMLCTICACIHVYLFVRARACVCVYVHCRSVSIALEHSRQLKTN